MVIFIQQYIKPDRLQYIYMMPRLRYLSALLLLYIIGVPSFYASGQSTKSVRAIRLKSGNVIPSASSGLWVDGLTTSNLPTQVLIQFDSLPSASERKALEKNGITLLDYIPENTFTAIISKQLNKGAAAKLPVKYMVNTQPEWKAEQYLWAKAAKINAQLKVVVSVYGGTDEAELKQLITSLEGRVEPGDMQAYGCYTVSLPAAKLRTLAGWYGIRYISPYFDPVPLDLQSIPAVKGSGAIAVPNFGGYGLNGDSVTIGVGDNTSGIFHIDNLDRIVNYNPAQVTNHGIHINGITGGAAIVNPLARSMTPKVKLLDFFFSTVLSSTGQMLAQHNMTITNNSYTVAIGDCDYFGTYDVYSRFLDTLALQYPTVQHVFAAGNDGNMSCSPYPKGYGTMGGGYQPSKNTLVVGSTTNNLVQAADQSRGPVRDGRIRPDVVAVGASVFSTFRYNNYAWAGGTSMASPQVASGLGILTQHYKRLNNAQPRADLLKAITIATAMDMGAPGPDFSFGFGMMDVGRALKAIEENRFATDEVANGQSKQITFTVPPGIAQAKVTLYWNDLPASPTAVTQLVNDLDLSVTTPASTTRLPLVPDHTLSSFLAEATEREDHLNNVEQVTISNPVPGTYTVTVKGNAVPFGPQRFVLVYDMLASEPELTYPLGGEQLSNVDSFRVFWNSVNDGSTVKVEFSSNNGDSWSVVDPAVPTSRHYCGILPSGLNSGNCRVRISRNSSSVLLSSQRFAISDTPNVRLSTSQCPGYVNVNWKPVPNAAAYEVLKKVGPQMVIVDTVTDTAYSYSNMSFAEVSYVAVQPILNGISGYRSIAVTRKASDGDCANPSSIGDLMVEKVISPRSGRLLTSTAPGATSNLTVQVRNLYNTACAGYTFAYSINGAPWQALVNPAGPLPAASATAIDVLGLPLATPGTYTVALAIQNNAVPDPQTTNDTLIYTFKIIANPSIDLSTPLTDGFETAAEIVVTNDALGITPNGYWDFYTDDDSGRIRSYVYDEVLISGSRSMSLDQFMPMNRGSRNQLIGTFNLSAYDTGIHEVRIDFDYVLHGIPNRKQGNLLRARGVDAFPFADMYTYDFSAYPGTVLHARSLSLTDAVRKTGQYFSASTQLSFGQNDTTLIAGSNYGTGITFDNFRMYTVANDAVLADVVSPQPNSCGLPSIIPLTVKVKNGVNYTINNVLINYTLDGGPVNTATINAISAKDSLNFTFPQTMNISGGTSHVLNVWLSTPGDTYLPNDSISDYQFRNSPIISSYPYLEDFESGDGGFYTSGFLSSWQYGTPAAPRTFKAASGTKAWKSNLSGRHNNLEQSYLYTPCYDISSLTQPMLSFSMSQDLENCGGTLCDGAYLEYSFDGLQWTKLGAVGEGFNWYDAPFNIWNKQSFTRWHVATIPLPQPPVGKVLHLRFALFADPAVTFEGLGIDDMHIYDKMQPIFPLGTSVVKVIESPTSNTWTDYLSSGKLVAGLMPKQSLGNMPITLYPQETFADPVRNQYVASRSFTISSESSPSDSVKVKLYLEDADFEKITSDTSCNSCAFVPDAYSLGVTQYYNTNNRAAENGTLSDDTGGTFIFHPSSQVKWVPYEKGYRAEFALKQFSELWLNNGGPTQSIPANTEYLGFYALRQPDAKPMLFWRSIIDAAVQDYILQRSSDGYAFQDVYTVLAQHQSVTEYRYIDTSATAIATDQYYRLRYHLTNSEREYFSPIRKLSLGDSAGIAVSLDANMLGSRKALVSWASNLGPLVDRYILQRAIDNGGYTQIESRTAINRYGQQYSFVDNINGIGTGTPVHYKLTVVLRDGTQITLPVKTIYWVDEAAVFGLYPNPTHNGSFTIRWNAEPGSKLQMAIMDITGRILETREITALSWDNTNPIRTEVKAKGMYMVRFVIGGYREVKKVVFE